MLRATLCFLFVSSSLMAQTAPVAKSQSDWSPLVGVVLMLGVFFFFIILPQSRKAKKQTAFLASLEKGDAIVTQSGLYGKITGIADKVITLEIAPNVRVRIDRQTVLAKDEFTPDSKDKNSGEKAA